jgi:hypothetical protein
MNQVKINVTRENIQQGKPFDFTKCPLGIALKQNFPYSKVWVGIWSFEIDGKKYDMPQNVVEFNCGFDTGKPVEPISFEIDL